MLARRDGVSLAELVAALPARFTAADRLQGIDRPAAETWLAQLAGSAEARAGFLGEPEAAHDLTDGVRMVLADGGIVHLRLSGNAPELRVYGEAESPEAAGTLVAHGLARVEAILAG